MARVRLTENAAAELRDLIVSHALPPDTAARFARSVQPLEDFPELGAELGGTYREQRFILGPWRWMVIVYQYYEADDLVAVLAIADGRTSTSPTANR